MTIIGMMRGMREVKAGVQVGLDYKLNWHRIDAEIHYRNAKRLYDMMVVNGGPFIKIGQAVGQMDTLLP